MWWCCLVFQDDTSWYFEMVFHEIQYLMQLAKTFTWLLVLLLLVAGVLVAWNSVDVFHLQTNFLVHSSQNLLRQNFLSVPSVTSCLENWNTTMISLSLTSMQCLSDWVSWICDMTRLYNSNDKDQSRTHMLGYFVIEDINFKENIVCENLSFQNS